MTAYIRDILCGVGRGREDGNAGIKWWQDTWADDDVDETLTRPGEGRKRGRLKVRHAGGTLETLGICSQSTFTGEDMDDLEYVLRDPENLGQIARRNLDAAITYLNDRYHQHNEAEGDLWPPSRNRMHATSLEEILFQ